MDPNDLQSRIDFLEQNLCRIREEHDVIVVDFQREIDRLQEENRDLRYRLTNDPPPEPPSSPTSNRSINGKQAHIDELQRQLLQSETKNKYLLQKLDEFQQAISFKSNTENDPSSARTNDSDHQHLITIFHEKQQLYIQQITKFRTVLLDILNAERLSVPAKILLRDCLNSTNISELAMSQTTTTPVDILFLEENQQQPQQRSTTTPSVIGKTCFSRHELPIHRLNISPPQAAIQRHNNQSRVNLPVILQRNNSTLSQHSIDVNVGLNQSISPIDRHHHHQQLFKIGETPIARRERRTQELQKNRLLKTLYH